MEFLLPLFTVFETGSPRPSLVKYSHTVPLRYLDSWDKCGFESLVHLLEDYQPCTFQQGDPGRSLHQSEPQSSCVKMG